MAADPTKVARVKKLRAMAQDPKIPASAKEQFLDEAARLEYEGYEASKGKKCGGSIKGMKEGGVAKTVTKEMEYDYKTGKKKFAGTTAQRDAHAEKEGKRVAKAAAYDKAKKYAAGGSVRGAGMAKGVRPCKIV